MQSHLSCKQVTFAPFTFENKSKDLLGGDGFSFRVKGEYEQPMCRVRSQRQVKLKMRVLMIPRVERNWPSLCWQIHRIILLEVKVQDDWLLIQSCGQTCDDCCAESSADDHMDVTLLGDICQDLWQLQKGMTFCPGQKRGTSCESRHSYWLMYQWHNSPFPLITLICHL